MSKQLIRKLAFSIALIIVVRLISPSYADATSRSIETPDILDGMVYAFQNENSGKYLTVKNSSTSSGAEIVQYEGGTMKSQQFRLEYTDSGYYYIIPMVNQALRLDVENASDSNYTLIQTYVPNSSYENAQQFKFIPDGNGYYKIMPRLSSTRVFDVVNASTSNNANIQLYTSYSQSCQRWAPVFSWSYNDSDYESENNNTISTADTVSLSEMLDTPTRMIGFISSSSDIDYYKINPPRHGYLEIELIPGIGCDYDLKIYNNSSTLIGTSAAGGDYNEHLFVTTLRNSSLDTYYIKVEGYSCYSTSYPYFLIIHYNDMHNKLCWGYPLPTSISNNKVVNSPVGYRSYDGTYHTGLDLNAASGQNVYSVCSGTVTTSTYENSAGNYIIVKSSALDPVTGNHIYVRYLHLNSRSVSLGASVTKGQLLGVSGNTGNSSGAHLHVDANNGNYQNSTGMLSNKSSIINCTDTFSNYINFGVGKPYLNT